MSIQVGIGTQFDIRPNSYLSQVGLTKLDLCMGSKRDLKSRSLFESLLTPIQAQVDIETDAIDLKKNIIRVHNVGLIELLLNPDVIKSNVFKIEKIIENIKKIIQRRKDENKRRQKVEVVAFDADINVGDVGNDNIINCNDILMVKSNKTDIRYFAAIQSIHKTCDSLETSVAGYWVTMQSMEDTEGDTCVFKKNIDDNGNVVMIKLKNILRDKKNDYMILNMTAFNENDGKIEWIVTDKQKVLRCLKCVEKHKK